jgi:hypothetical protein
MKHSFTCMKENLFPLQLESAGLVYGSARKNLFKHVVTKQSVEFCERKVQLYGNNEEESAC